MDKAPEIVRTCYQSVKKYASRQVVLLTENNVQNYINMPDYLNEKLKSGVLPLAIYTDLMRVALTISIVDAKKVHVLGTPEELQTFLHEN